MKFDKFMEHCYKILCLVTAMIVFVGALVSCASRPVSVHADYVISDFFPDWYWDYLDASTQEFWEVETNRRELIQPNVNSAMNDSELTSSERDSINSVWSLQETFLNAWQNIYNTYSVDNFSSMPDSVAVSGSGVSGIYQSYKDNKNHVVILLSGGNSIESSVASSDEFSLHFAIESNIDITGYVTSSFSGTNANYSCTYTRPSTATFTITFPNDSYFTSGYSATYTFGAGTNSSNLRLGFDSYSIPVLSASLPWSSYVGKSNRLTIGGYGVSVSLPESTVDSPWNYYNTTLLPFMKQNFPDVPDSFYVFPDGYSPTQDPTEPNYINPNLNFNGVAVGGLAPIILGAGAIINVAGNSINVFAPVDGQIRIDGIQLQFPLDNDNTVYVDKTPYNLPTPELQIGDHLLEIINKSQLVVDGLDWLINGDGTLTIDDITFNLPIGEIETIPIDASNFVYKYEIPTMERINVVDATLSPVDLSSFADGVSGFYGLAARLYYDLGLFNPLIICLSFAAVGYAVSKIGGGH